MSDWDMNTVSAEVKPAQVLFTKIDDLKKHKGLRVGVYGKYGTGKSRFCMSSVDLGRTYYVDTEARSDQLQRFFRDKDIQIVQTYLLGSDGELDGTASMRLVKQAFDYAIKKGDAKTLVLDSATDFWYCCQEFMKVTHLKIDKNARLKNQFEWAIAKNAYLDTILKLLSTDCNVILAARVGDEYAGPGQPTGEYEPKWMKDTSNYLDIIIDFKKYVQKDIVRFYATIEKSTGYPELLGKTFENLTFPMLLEEIRKIEEGK